jgi:hypothetical protein
MENLFYLPEMIDVVPGKHAYDVFDRFLATFRMPSGPVWVNAVLQ